MDVKKVVDSYLYLALPIDALIVAILWLSNSNLNLIEITYNLKSTNIEIISNVIGASISLAGFVLASLTIIVAIRSSVKNRKPEEAKNALELFFSIGTYKTIVKVFKIAIIELVFTFIASYCIWLLSANFTNSFMFKCALCLIFLLAASTIRSLFVLFLLISRDDK